MPAVLANYLGNGTNDRTTFSMELVGPPGRRVHRVVAESSWQPAWGEHGYVEGWPDEQEADWFGENHQIKVKLTSYANTQDIIPPITFTADVTVDVKVAGLVARLESMEKEVAARLERMEKDTESRLQRMNTAVDGMIGLVYARCRNIEREVERLSLASTDSEEKAMVDAVMMDELWRTVSSMVHTTVDD